jgi:hypothetical protein
MFIRKLQTVKDLKGKVRGLMVVLLLNLPGGTRKNHETLQCLERDSDQGHGIFINPKTNRKPLRENNDLTGTTRGKINLWDITYNSRKTL